MNYQKLSYHQRLVLLEEQEKKISELRSLLNEYNFVTISTICSFKEGTIGYNDLDRIRKKVEESLKK